MDAPIAATFRWTREEWLCAQRLAARHSRIGQPVRVARILGIVFLAVGAANLAMRPSEFGAIGLPALGAYFVSMPLFMRRAALKLYGQKADRDMPVSWQISNDRVSSKTDLAASDLSWSTFLRVTRLPQGFLLFPNERVFHWLPIHAFANDADVERFAALARSKVRQYDRPA